MALKKKRQETQEQRYFIVDIGKNRGEKEIVERRHYKDVVSRTIPFFSIIGWIAAILTFIFLGFAKPQSGDFFSYTLADDKKIPVAGQWNNWALRVVLLLLILVFVFCLVGFILNLVRYKKKADRFYPVNIILGIISLASIIGFLVIFAPYI